MDAVGVTAITAAVMAEAGVAAAGVMAVADTDMAVAGTAAVTGMSTAVMDTAETGPDTVVEFTPDTVADVLGTAGEGPVTDITAAGT